MEDKKRANITDYDRRLLTENAQILGLGSTPAKDIYALTVALGMNNPQRIPIKNSSWIRADTLDTNTVALMGAVRLGAADVNEDNINEHANHNDCISYGNMCSYTGFRKLEQLIKEVNSDNDELIAELMVELDRLYRKNVELEEF